MHMQLTIAISMVEVALQVLIAIHAGTHSYLNYVTGTNCTYFNSACGQVFGS